MVIDGVVNRLTEGRLFYDRDGLIAAAGQRHPALLAKLLTHPYLAKQPPKSTGREDFGADYIGFVLDESNKFELTIEDLIATVTAFTVETIARHYEEYIIPRYGMDEVIIGGGGAYNPTLLRLLATRIAPVPVRRHEDYGISSNAKEAIAFAILANEALHGEPTNLPAVTGAKRPVVLGKFIL
jgi:anhydro-N-acetylmuramic acid kinase